MSHIDAEFSVFTDDETFELVARQGDAAGVIGVSDPANVDIELDAADPSQVTAVRLWHDGRITPEQLAVLEVLLGDQAGHVASLFGNGRPQRTGLRSRRMTSLGGDVSAELTLFVSAHDALARVETHPAVRPLLALAANVANVANATGALELAVPALPDLDALAYAVLGTAPDARLLLDDLLAAATAHGFLDPALAAALTTTSRASTEPMFAASELLDVSFSRAELSPVLDLLSRSTQRAAEPLVLHPAVVLDPSSVPCTSVTTTWEHHANLLVRAVGAPSGVTLWVRARRDADGTIVAAGPLVPSGDAHEALLLVAETDHVVVDIVTSLDAPVLSHAAGALARAYRHGRRAARLERLGRIDEAEDVWRECARLHALAGDPQREKLALARRFTRRGTAPASIVDHLLD